MSSTPQPPPSQPHSLSHPDSEFAAFLRQVCLPLGRLHVGLNNLQLALGPEQDPRVEVRWQQLLNLCRQLEARLDRVETDLNGSLQTLAQLLGMLGDKRSPPLSTEDVYRILSLTHQQLRRASAELYLR
ncbi:hypothetical protein [Aquitalea sp.]|uniref:hypothetical protein n=1 Tax=Aquitalea sp. TaxID=1872623 RepID=UPI00258D057B|nr:hypothetical protein [Aquitalea sp.]